MFDAIGPLVHGAISSTGESISLQKQLIGHLKQKILMGSLPAGSLLPSSRVLAEELGVSRNTVVIAYEHLVAEGYVLADRQGTRVISISNVVGYVQNTILEPISLARRLEPFSRIQSQPVSKTLLLPGTPAIDRFPVSSWRRSLIRAIDSSLPHTLGYGIPTGEPVLRDAIATYLSIVRGVHCDGSQVIITEGTQDALNLCVTLLTNPNDIAWVEDPGYRGAKAAFYAGDLQTIPVRVDQEGLTVPPDMWRTHPPKLIYTSPAHQYPTGAVLSVARRLDLIARAMQAGAWLIEDDYDSEFRHNGEPITSMQGLVPDAPVLYIGSFSKTMFPALRIGFLVLPRTIIRQAQGALHELLRGGHRLEQLALAHFIESGEFGRHLGRMRRLYRERQRVLRDALMKHFAETQILGGNAGMHLTLKLPPHINDRKIVEDAHTHGIAARALSTFSISPTEQECGLVIGYGNTHAEDIPDAVNILAQLIQDALTSQ